MRHQTSSNLKFKIGWVLFLYSICFLGVVKYFTRSLVQQRFKRGAELSEKGLEHNLTQFHGNESQLICKSPTINEFPRDFVPFEESLPYASINLIFLKYLNQLNLSAFIFQDQLYMSLYCSTFYTEYLLFAMSFLLIHQKKYQKVLFYCVLDSLYSKKFFFYFYYKDLKLKEDVAGATFMAGNINLSKMKK